MQASIAPTETINGFPIIATFNFAPAGYLRGGRVIIVDRGESHTFDRYVATHQLATDGILDNSWSQGHYCTSLVTAFATFTDLALKTIRED